MRGSSSSETKCPISVGVVMIIGLWMLLRRRWTVPASGEDSPDDAVPAVEMTAETEA